MNRLKYGFLILFFLILGCTRKQSDGPIYNEQADGRRDIAAAITNAGQNGRNIVLIFGANW